jgi:fumarylacetoacetate (FAA) hydrolase
MKLASLNNGTRDGRLLVVSRDLKRAALAPAPDMTLISVIECWDSAAPRLLPIYQSLCSDNAGGLASEIMDFPRLQLAAPLPRAPQWLDASAFHSHGDLMELAFKTPPMQERRMIPLMYQGASDDFLGPFDDMPMPSESDGIDFEAEIAVVVDRVPMGTGADRALAHVKLLLLVNDASLRTFTAREVRSGFGFLQAKPSTSFAPVAITPDELGDSWQQARVRLPVNVYWNQRPFGHPHAGAMGFGFHELVAHAARTRNLSAGTIVGSGTISNDEHRTVGSACIAERRAIEMIEHGEPATQYMNFGDSVRIEVLDTDGASVFGAIDQRMVPATTPSLSCKSP